MIRYFLLLIFLPCLFSFYPKQAGDDAILSYTVDPKKQDLRFYWKNDSGAIFHSIQHLKTAVEQKRKTLVFAMNGGMYTTENAPLGLYIENFETLKKLNTSKGHGNFHMKPNGVFYITADNTGHVCTTGDFKNSSSVKYATQSGPMLVADGAINAQFTQGSANLNIRNGVGVLPDNRLVFAMSKAGINFYDFALYFKSLGCKNALYLDGAISRTYLPQQNWLQTGGDFGVIIAVVK